MTRVALAPVLSFVLAALPFAAVCASCVERELPEHLGGPEPIPLDAGGARTRRDAGTPSPVLASLPADGTLDVPPSLASVAVLLRADVRDASAWVVTRDGRVPSRLVQSRCEAHGFEPDAGSCSEVPVVGALPVDAPFAIEIEAAGVTASLAMRTAAQPDARVPVLGAPFPCEPDEIALQRACVRIEDVAVVLRVVVDEPARCGARSRSGVEAVSWYAGGVATLRLGGLRASEDELVWWWAEDLAGNRSTDGPFAARTAPARDAVALAEVSANPRGPEPAQEWIEVLSWGTSEIDVGGFVIVDESGAEIVLPVGSSLRAGERALVVSEAFEASDSRDPLPAPGTRLLRVPGRSLGRSGLRNTGEPLTLLGLDRRVVSRAPALDLAAGTCAARVGPADVDDVTAWARGPCTPGRAP